MDDFISEVQNYIVVDTLFSPIFGHWWFLEEDLLLVHSVGTFKIINIFTVLFLTSKVLESRVFQLSTVFESQIFIASEIECPLGIRTVVQITFTVKNAITVKSFIVFLSFEKCNLLFALRFSSACKNSYVTLTLVFAG